MYEYVDFARLLVVNICTYANFNLNTILIDVCAARKRPLNWTPYKSV